MLIMWLMVGAWTTMLGTSPYNKVVTTLPFDKTTHPPSNCNAGGIVA
jgi:hypothetical protein